MIKTKMVYIDRPRDFSPIFAVAACFCEFQGTFLFLKRSLHKPHGGTWCLPAGKIEKGETALQAVLRETFEETSLLLHKDQVTLLKKVYVRYPECDFDYYMFKTELMEYFEKTTICLNEDEHQMFRFITINEALKFNLILGEEECIELVYNQLVV
jgi:8-oxo-dGTP pyrophosphatase MutT (NUDIX family)